MQKLVRETAAGRSISAWIILDKKRQQVATIQAYYADSGRVTVDVWNQGDAALKCYRAAFTDTQKQAAEEDAAAEREWLRGRPDDLEQWAAFDTFNLQQGAAGGHGYDKLTAAMAGIWIDGHRLADHCGTAEPAAEKQRVRLLRAYEKAAAEPDFDHAPWKEKAAKIGATFANYRDGRYRNLYFEPGLDRLRTLSYRVIQAI